MKLTTSQRFDAKVRKTATCWLWTGAITKKTGYGRFNPDGEVIGAHIYAWERANGRKVPIDPVTGRKLDVCHTCDVKHCVRDDHLFDGPRKKNMEDAVSKGRQAKGEVQGHAKLTASEVRAIRASPESNTDLGLRYGVDPSNISHIRNRKSWKHV